MTNTISEEEASIIARERLRILTIGFYVRNGMMLVFGCFFLIYVAMFAGMSLIPQSAWNESVRAGASPSAFASVTPSLQVANQGAPPVIFFRVMAGVFCGVVLVVWTLGALTVYAGRCIQKRRRKLFVYVMAALNCLFIPYGTLLGVFTFVVLSSVAVSREFGLAAAQ